MKRLTTLLTMAITFTGLGQQMPYNPDANGDDFVGVDDVLGVLGVYDTALMQPDLQCDYEGTDLEEFIGGIFSGDLVLDSIYVEYLLVDSAEQFLPGCPDPVLIETVLERSYVLGQATSYNYGSWVRLRSGFTFLGHLREALFYFYDDGRYRLELVDFEVSALTSLGQQSAWNEDGPDNCCTSTFPLPFPEHWELNDDGIQVDWTPNHWVGRTTHFRLIPFWHEAE